MPYDVPRDEWDPGKLEEEAREKAALAGRPQSREQFASALGRVEGSIDVSGDDNRGNLAAKLRAIAGTSKRSPSGVDTKAAAKKLGVTQRTVQRWLKDENAPSDKHWKKIRTKSRQVATTKRGRAQAVKRVRDHMAKGGWLVLQGDAGPLRINNTDAYKRHRFVQTEISAEQANTLLDAYVEHGEQGAVDGLYGILTTPEEQGGYMETWGMESIDQLDLRSADQGKVTTQRTNRRSGNSRRR